MKAVVTGASGLLGGNLALELLRQGHAVRATRRSPASTRHLDGHAIEWVPGDLDEPAALSSAFAGADVVFHCAALVSILPHPTPQLVATNVTGTRHVIDAVRQARVPRLVHCSTVGAVGLSEDGAPCTEEARWNFPEHGLGDGYVTTKRQAEDVVREATFVGLDAVIVNPTYMLGPYDAKPSSGKMIVGVILAWQKGRTGERYILGGENLGYEQIFNLIAEVAGVAPLTRKIPRPVATLFGWAGDLQHWLSGKEPLVTSMSVRWGYETAFQFSSAKAQRELGYAYGPLQPAIADAIAWFRAHGLLPATGSGAGARAA
jgi:dihydroflavonol-4-reductase